MTPFVQAVLVVVIVAVAAGYAALKLMPAVLRRSLASRAAALAAHAGLSDVHARRVEAKLSTGGACGSCDSCNACAAPSNELAPPSATSFKTIAIRPASPDATR